MPQMAPTLWWSLMVFVTMLIIMINTSNFFYKNFNMSSKKLPMTKKFNWMW